MKIEGKNPVKEILKSGETIEKIMIENGSSDGELREIQRQAREKGIKVEFVDKKRLDKLSQTGHHQGVIAEQNNYKYFDLKDVIATEREKGRQILLIILDEISDPHNLGSIVRVAECAGASGVIISNRRSVTVNETVVRTSAGATAYLPIIKVNNINSAIETLKSENIWIYALDMDGKEMYDVSLTGDIAIVVGSEGNGVGRLTRKLCDNVISIPMFGKVNSLNASVSAGIGIYEVIRQRRK